MNLQTHPLPNSYSLSESAPLIGSEISSLANVLSRICHDEPNLEYIIPDQAARRMLLPSFLQAAILAGQLNGQVHISENHDGIAVWIGPEHNLALGEIMHSMLPALPEECVRRYVNLVESIEVARTHVAMRPHWYLMFLAVDASLPGKKIGETLIAPVLSQADSTGTPCYLENFNANRLSLYRDCGFQITGAGRISGGGPNFWSMGRTVLAPPFPRSCILF
jgi:GNAT superfamily N-acetyltransferase